MASYRRIHYFPTGLRVLPLLLATLAALSLLTIPLAHADDVQGPAFGIHPAAGSDPHLRFTIEPGQSQSAEVRIINRGDAPGNALSFVADAQTMVGGGFGVASVNAPRHGATLWVDFADEVTALAPGSQVLRPVTVSVPVGTPPGEYIVGMAIQGAPDAADANAPDAEGVTLNIVNRQAMGILVTVPGERTSSIAIGSVSMEDGGQNSTIQIELINDGGTHLTPSGKVTVATPDGQVLADVGVDFGRFYAGTTSAIYLPVEGFLPVGTYVISTEVWDDEADVRAAATDQQLVVSSRELPNGEQAATITEAGPVIQAPVSAQREASQTSADMGSPLMLLLGVSVGVGLVVVAAGVVVVMLLQRRGTATAN